MKNYFTISIASLSFIASILPVAIADELETTATSLVAGQANSYLSQLSQTIRETSSFEHLTSSVGTQSGENYGELLSVYGLIKTADKFVFNQTSVSSHDGVETANTGFGYRTFTQSQAIIGINTFLDYEFSSAHKRVGIGAEYLTDALELRANYYHPTTKAKSVKGIQEAALKGHDYTLSYYNRHILPLRVNLKSTRWYDGKGFTESATTIGASYQITPNISLSAAREKYDGQKANTNMSLSYKIALGAPSDFETLPDSRSERLQQALYAPVERENKIRKKSIKLGVTVGSY